MISLFITALLGLFCCSSININPLDNTKEIGVNEHVSKNMMSLDDTYFVFTNLDIASSNFINHIYLNHTAFFFDIAQVGQTLDVPIELGAQFIQYSNFNFTTLSGNATYELGRIFVECVSYNIDGAFDSGRYFEYKVKLADTNNQVQMNLRYFFYRTDVGQFNDGVYNYEGELYRLYAVTSTLQENVLLLNRYNQPQLYSLLRPLNDNEKYSLGYKDGYRNGYGNGFYDGLNDYPYDYTALTIFEGIIEVGLLPVNVFLTILNFEVFGINIGGLVTSLLTISIVIIIIRFLTGQKDD